VKVNEKSVELFRFIFFYFTWILSHKFVYIYNLQNLSLKIHFCRRQGVTEGNNESA